MTRGPGESPRDWFVRVVTERNAVKDDLSSAARYQELKVEAEQARAEMQSDNAPGEAAGDEGTQSAR